MTVDLVSRTVTAGELVAAFEVDDYTRWRLLEGLDDISLTLRHEGRHHGVRGLAAQLEADRHRLIAPRTWLCRSGFSDAATAAAAGSNCDGCG